MATRALKPMVRTNSLADPRHLLRYLKSQAKMTDEEIAKSEGVSAETVRNSVKMVEVYRAQNTTFEMDLAVRDMVISTIPQMKQTMHGLLTATELVERTDQKTGQKKVVTVDDKVTRLEALKIGRGLISDLQPKTPPVEVKVSQVNQTANISTAETNEERFRRLRKRAEEHDALPPEVAAVPDYIDAGGTSADDEDDEDESDDEDE